MPKAPAKYYRLQRHLEASAEAEVTLSFAEIEALIGASLPATAQTLSWWTNAMRTPQARAWLEAGYHMREVRVQEQTVTFARRVTDG
jgi:adenosine deaminase